MSILYFIVNIHLWISTYHVFLSQRQGFFLFIYTTFHSILWPGTPLEIISPSTNFHSSSLSSYWFFQVSCVFVYVHVHVDSCMQPTICIARCTCMWTGGQHWLSFTLLFIVCFWSIKSHWPRIMQILLARLGRELQRSQLNPLDRIKSTYDWNWLSHVSEVRTQMLKYVLKAFYPQRHLSSPIVSTIWVNEEKQCLYSCHAKKTSCSF